MWREEEAFERLKAVAQRVMDDLARQCDTQSGLMAQEPGGPALLNSEFFGPCHPAAAAAAAAAGRRAMRSAAGCNPRAAVITQASGNGVELFGLRDSESAELATAARDDSGGCSGGGGGAQAEILLVVDGEIIIRQDSDKVMEKSTSRKNHVMQHSGTGRAVRERGGLPYGDTHQDLFRVYTASPDWEHM